MFTIVVSSRIMKKPRQSAASTSQGLCRRPVPPFVSLLRIMISYPGAA
jgi:hypothetical protein